MSRELRLFIAWLAISVGVPVYTLMIYMAGVAEGEVRTLAKWNASRFK